jgi:hypothetical protein
VRRTITARPIRPISPLDSVIEKDGVERGESTHVAMAIYDERWWLKERKI